MRYLYRFDNLFYSMKLIAFVFLSIKFKIKKRKFLFPRRFSDINILISKDLELEFIICIFILINYYAH